MKIIGWLKKGNVVRFFLGKDDLEYWSGDDWSDRPYEHNALTFPLFDIEAEVDVAFNLDVSVMEPGEDSYYKKGSPYSMDDFKARETPIICIDPTGEEECYSRCAWKGDVVFSIFMGDKFEDINWNILGGTIINENLSIFKPLPNPGPFNLDEMEGLSNL